MPEEMWFLETAIEPAQVYVQKHGDSADLAGFAEFKEVVLEELVAFHRIPPPNPPPKMQKTTLFWCGGTLRHLEWY